jgi:flavin reductase (DIM6/NTAB) family NADH-FMN oxidoreductase RutF
MNTELTQTTALSPATTPSAFTEAMSLVAGGVAMVTTRLDDRPWGITVSAFASVSAAPPTVLVSLCSDTAAAQAIEETGSFGVSILGRQHRSAARHGSTPGAPKFLERFADPRSDALTPAILGALAHLDCDVVERVEVADHTIFIGRVRAVRAGLGGEPLVYFRRAYRTLAPCAGPSTRGGTPCLSS